MSFAPTDEQRELQQLVRRFCEEKSPVAEVRRLMDTEDGFDTAVWDQMGKELGLQALFIPEIYGGMGYTVIEAGLVLEEMGRALLCVPFLSSVVLAANAILACGTDEQRKLLLPGIAGGQVRGALAFTETTDTWRPGVVTTEATPDGLHYRLQGLKTLVVDGHTAHTIIVSARTPGSIGTDAVSLFVVQCDDAPGMTRRVLPTLDQTRKLATVEFDGTPAQLLGEIGSGWSALEHTLKLAAVCLACEQLGGAARCLDMSVEYAKMRMQFGRPIGSFQAIKHRCADMLLGVESARSAAYYALSAAAADDELPMASALARAHCSEVFSRAASENIQIHGGVGFTWEHDAHLYLKRAKSSEALFGGIGYQQDLIAAGIGL
ncbi:MULTISPECIES: acyl-CoA dehydrogenase family protein [unclassified Rhodococcus (in: high G+C Gram-positive bacteria)]|uniref:acyl-CoA dehydrogenase family protein n=1 Tax=unclassified Rhodococcus (in: high G+C Gram-positive bacteria) TaxID=192944 RepID=UPI000300AF73|nr:acyl-CoA dehydrogenase family protein [Rhodococcus sp. DK17]